MSLIEEGKESFIDDAAPLRFNDPKDVYEQISVQEVKNSEGTIMSSDEESSQDNKYDSDIFIATNTTV